MPQNKPSTASLRKVIGGGGSLDISQDADDDQPAQKGEEFFIVEYDEVMQAMAESNERRENSNSRSQLPQRSIGATGRHRKASGNFDRPPQKVVVGSKPSSRFF